MKKKFKILIPSCLAITIILVCIFGFLLTANEQVEETVETDRFTMPDDFAISFCYGPNENQFNMLDTFTGKIQKDLIGNGTADTDFVIQEEDLNDIYTQICNYKIYEITENMTSSNFISENESGIWITPTMNYRITFTMNDTEYNISGDYTASFYQEKSEQADNFWSFITYMTEYYQTREEYKAFPEALGAYQ